MSVSVKKMDAAVNKIHDCSELPSLTDLAPDANCLEVLASDFKSWKWRGAGQYGFVLETMTGYGNPMKTEALVVKISEVNAVELRVACELNSMITETPIFPHVYGWLICPKVPEDWLSFLRVKDRNHMILLRPPPVFMFTFVQPVKDKWDDILLPVDNGYRVSLFFLLHGLYVARRMIGFNHGDIHSGNVMVEYHREETTTALRYGGGGDQYDAEVRSRYVPRLIDYGRSTTTVHNEQEGASDLKQLRKMFDDRLDYDIEENLLGADDEAVAFNAFVSSVGWRKCEELYGRNGNADLILSMLTHNYFDIPEIQRHRIKRQATEPIQRCFSCCGANPKHQINHQVAAPKYFCGDRCYAQIHGICRFIK